MASRKIHEEQDSQDSFLDVVANVVGVLIILVMLVGMQATQSLTAQQRERLAESSAQAAQEHPAKTVSEQDLDDLKSRVKLAKREVLESRQEVVDLATKVTRIGSELSSQEKQRVELAMHRSLIEEDIERRREELDDQSRQEFDVQRKLLASQLELEDLNQQRIVLASAPSEVEEIEVVPTPQAKEVDVPSIHLRLRDGLVSIVPVESLLDEMRFRLPDIQRRLQSSSNVREVVGPIDGYRLKSKYLKRARRPVGGSTVGSRVVNEMFQIHRFEPVDDEIGESVEQALTPGQRLHTYLQSKRRESPPVDVWLYTDSFDEFRVLKKALWKMGFAISTRPLQPGDHIEASPLGTKSAAQ